MPSVSFTVPPLYSELGIAREIVSVAATTPRRAPESPAVDRQHRPLRLINRHSEDAGHIGPARGFLPRGLFNACPHACSFAHELHGRGQASNKPKRQASLRTGEARSLVQMSVTASDEVLISITCPSLPRTRHTMEISVKVNEAVAVVAHLDFRRFDEHYRVRTDILRLNNPTSQARERSAQNGHTIFAMIPDRQPEALFHREFSHPRKVPRDAFQTRRQHVDTNLTIAIEDGMHRAGTVQAHQQRGWRVSDGADGARRDAALTVRASRRDDVDCCAEVRHRLPELLTQRIDCVVDRSGLGGHGRRVSGSIDNRTAMEELINKLALLIFFYTVMLDVRMAGLLLCAVPAGNVSKRR